MTVVEICVEDVAGVVAARRGGADRVELCRELSCGGLTPDPDVVASALVEAPPRGIQVLVRSRPGDFVYAAEEIDAMCRQIRAFVDLTRDAPCEVGFVVGALGSDSRIDEDALAAFVAAADGRRLTFHRAFDGVPDQHEALETLIRHGVGRVLTTGGNESRASVSGLRDLVRRAAGRIVILASGGLRSHNVAEVVHATGTSEVHLRAPGADGSGTDVREVERVVEAVG